MTRNAKSSVIVHNVIALAHGLGMSTVAEGVEDEATLRALKLAGCRAAQGYLLSRPLPAAEYERWRDSRPTAVAAV
jgi:EAL domain-containing protein (putative c-di-GMP-specific phosphodiesterase class I)